MDLSFVYTTKSKFDNNEVALQHGQVIAVRDISGGNDALYIDLLDETSGQVTRHSFSSGGGGGVTPTAYCNTGASTAAKTATCTNYQLLDNSYTVVLVTNANSYAGALTLSINGKTAKPIYIDGSASSSTNYTLPAGSYLVYYDGTNYYFRTDGKITTLGLKNTSNGDIYTNNSGTVTKVSTGVGLTGGDITGTGTVKAKLRSETALTNDSAAATETSGRVYPVAQDKSGYLAVNVPWTDNNTWKANSSSSEGYVASGSGQANKVWKTNADGVPAWRDDSNTWKANSSSSEGYVASGSGQANKVWKTNADGVPAWRDDANTTYSSKEAASGGTDVSLVTTGEKATWNAKTSNTGTVTKISTGVGLTGGDVTTTGTIKAKLRSETALTNDSAAATETSGRVYPVVPDKSGYLAVNVPWTDNNNRRCFYGTCSTAAGTQVKAVTLSDTSGWELKAGTLVGVKFSNTNTYSSTTSAPVKLNVNSTGNKNIIYNGVLGTSGNTGTYTSVYGIANHIFYYMYDGTNWVWAGSDYHDGNTVPSAHCTTAAGTAAKTAACTDYALLSKSYIMVIIKNANTSASALTLSINSKTAKPIYINGSASSSSNYTLPAGSYLVYYDGTNYYFRTDGKITGDITGSANYSSMSQSEANTGTATTGRLITAAVLDTKIRNVVNEFTLSVSLEDGHLYYGF